MTLPPRSTKLLALAGALLAPWLALFLFTRSAPVVVLHYSSAAREPVTCFFNEDNDIVKDQIAPGARLAFRTRHRPGPGYVVDVSLPAASRDGVEIKPPFSRVDV